MQFRDDHTCGCLESQAKTMLGLSIPSKHAIHCGPVGCENSTFGALVKIPEMNSVQKTKRALAHCRDQAWPHPGVIYGAQGDEVTSSSSLHQKSMAWQLLDLTFSPFFTN